METAMPSHKVRLEGTLLSRPLTVRVKARTRSEAVDIAIDTLAPILRADLIAGKDHRSRVIDASIGGHRWKVSLRYDYDSPSGVWRSIDSVEELANPLMVPLYTWTSPDVTNPKARRVKHGRRCRYMPR